VVSIFLGDELDAIVQSIIRGTEFKESGKQTLQIGIDVLPPIPQDNTDRNRTSPMAFTGNKFEFRMVGSSQSVSGPNITLNTVMAEQLRQFADELEGSADFQADLQKLIRRVFTEHQRIIFNGNGYDDAWIAEAEKRGLCNLVTTADALPVYTAPKNVDLFVKHGIYTEGEMQARAAIHVANYRSVISIEAKTMVDMVRHDILPAVSGYGAELCDRIAAKENCGMSCKYEKTMAEKVTCLTDRLMEENEKLDRDVNAIPAEPNAAMEYCHKVLVRDMEQMRATADELEVLTPSDWWPFPVYSELLYSE